MQPEREHAPIPLSTSSISSKKQWKSSSYKLGFKRSPALLDIDSAVVAYHQAMQTAADDYTKRARLSTELLQKIETWEGTKLGKTGPKTDRQLAVDSLKGKAQGELNRLRQHAAQELGQKLQAATFKPEKVAIYSAGILLDNTGRFSGASAQEYETSRAALGDAASERDTRLGLLKTKLDHAYRKFKKPGKHSAETLGIFTLPEWFFKQPGVPFTQQDNDYIEEKCKEYSAACPGMLIVPGSTIWTKGSGNDLELRNTASAYFDGELLHQTHKQQMLFDEDGYNKIEMRAAWDRAIQTNQSSSLFTLGNRLLALEICGDHSSGGRASKEQYHTYGEAVGSDIHILISKGAAIARGFVPLKTGGIGISNDATAYSSEKGGGRSVLSRGTRERKHPDVEGSYKYVGNFQHSTHNDINKLHKTYMGKRSLPRH